MRALVVYESMYGNTRVVAEAIGRGLGNGVLVLPVNQATGEVLDDLDLLVVGGPTHVHGMSRPRTREAAAEVAAKPDKALELEPDAAGAGLREWFDALGTAHAAAAAFDTRVVGPTMVTGQASKGVAKHLKRAGCHLVMKPESFVVDKATHLLPDEEARAEAWGVRLAELVTLQAASTARPS